MEAAKSNLGSSILIKDSVQSSIKNGYDTNKDQEVDNPTIKDAISESLNANKSICREYTPSVKTDLVAMTSMSRKDHMSLPRVEMKNAFVIRFILCMTSHLLIWT